MNLSPTPAPNITLLNRVLWRQQIINTLAFNWFSICKKVLLINRWFCFFVQSPRFSVQPPAKRGGWQTEVWTLNFSKKTFSIYHLRFFIYTKQSLLEDFWLNSLEDKSKRQRLQGFYSILVLLKENLQAGSSATK